MKRPYIDLFPALNRGLVPVGKAGFIFEARFHNRSDYSIVTISVFPDLRRIYARPDRGGVDLRTDGHQFVVAYEPAGYHQSFQEPYLREKQAKIPFRFTELHTIELERRDRLLVSKEPHQSMGMIMVDLPARGEFVYFFPDQGEETEKHVHLMLMSLFRKTFNIKPAYLDRLTDYFRENLASYRGHVGRYSAEGFNPMSQNMRRLFDPRRMRDPNA